MPVLKKIFHSFLNQLTIYHIPTVCEEERTVHLLRPTRIVKWVCRVWQVSLLAVSSLGFPFQKDIWSQDSHSIVTFAPGAVQQG